MLCGKNLTVKHEHWISLYLLALLLRISSIEFEGGRTWQGFQTIQVLLAANWILGSRKVRHTRIPLSFEPSELASTSSTPLFNRSLVSVVLGRQR